jgi:2-oxoglutarate dehydrogenase E1 component
LGQLLAQVNPLLAPPASHPLLDLARFGLSPADLVKPFTAGKLIGLGVAPLNDILKRLRATYCQTIGVEFTHIQNTAERNWLQTRMEKCQNREELPAETKKWILRRMTEAETFERFLHTRYVAQKRFSLEGAEALIPALDCMIEQGVALGVEEFVMGMAHRGRLNVLVNLFGKKPEYIFTEFEGSYKADTALGEGDVKYHMGYSSDNVTRQGKKVHLSLASNPSHLEFVNPVIEGVARAKQNQRQDVEQQRVVPVVIHGDAAFAGQGVCYETLNLSQLKGYKTGGTIHFVINNQVGFTTSPEDARSTTYSTDLAKMLEVPIFHVNGDDPESLWYISKLCIEYRQKFKKDIFVDLICYRKHGHNEGDEPTFTQPLLYKKIKTHDSSREIYAQQLVSTRVLTDAEPTCWVDEVTAKLIEAQTKTKAEVPKPFVSAFEGAWKKLRRSENGDVFKPVTTAVSKETLQGLAQKLNQTPASFHLHSKLVRFLEIRKKSIEEGKGIDWGNGEVLAFASLLIEGHAVRLSGQDVERGTFSHRHSVLNDTETGEKYIPLNHLQDGQAPYLVYNSHLSESGVLGFEYGYSLADPNTLVIWEAQFGDFANGAQVIIDQFISSSESKWQRMSGLTLLLPHGFEGMGPEHSSARLERFLQLCGKQNMAICNLTTPAQLFHALRRQMKRDFRKPLVIMSPKSLLRNPAAVSDLQDFSDGSFEEVLDDRSIGGSQQRDGVKKIVLCSGKVYYDLLSAKLAAKRHEIALIRLEQLYPWPSQKLAQIINQYPKTASLAWVQEEPRNMGGWSFVFNQWNGGYDSFNETVGGRSITYVGREIGAAPAVGSHKLHEMEQESLVQKALTV